MIFFYHSLIILLTGVPQGSVLRPVFLIIYISDLPNSIKHGKAITFADDTTILIKSVEDVYDELLNLIYHVKTD